MSSGKSSTNGQNLNYYGHCAGVVCQGQLDFIFGLLINNNLAWPNYVKLWDSNIYKAGTTFIYSDGKAYQTPIDTQTDPIAAPWALLAVPWVAGAYVTGQYVIYNGNIWKCTANTSSVPPGNQPARKPIGVQNPVVYSGWTYISTPQVWSNATPFWPANSIVAFNGYLYINSVATKAQPPNAPWTRWRQNRGVNPLKFTVVNMGDVYLYWGLPDQVLDSVGEQVLSQLGHPPYRNKAVLFLKNFLFGQGTQSPPSVQILGGRNPVQSLITGASAQMDSDWQVNPWCVLAEMLTHPIIGLGLPLTYFNQAAWQAEADHCATNPALFYISPLYDSLKKMREIVADLMQYPDAFIFWTNVGKLSAGHWPHGEAAPVFDSTNTINRDSMTEEFEWETGLWGDTAGAVQVNFKDLTAGFKNRPAFANNLFNQKAIKRLQSKQVDRPHITRYAQAAAWAAEFAKIAGDQVVKSQSLTIQSEKATAVTPGSLFLVTDDVLGVSQIQRCTGITNSAPPTGTRKITHETERGVAPIAYHPTGIENLQGSGEAPTRVTNYTVIQLPSALGPAASLAVLIGRTNTVTTSCDIYFQSADTQAFQFLGTDRIFGVAGTFDTDINTADTVGGNSTEGIFVFFVNPLLNGTYQVGDSNWWQEIVEWATDQAFTVPHTAVAGVDYISDPVAGTILVLSTGSMVGNWVRLKYWNALAMNYDTACPQSDLDAIMSSLTQDEVNNGETLLIAFQNSNPAIYEIMSVRSVQAVGNGTQGKPTWFVKVVRQMFGTNLGGDGTHIWGSDSNDVIMAIPRSGLVVLTHESFAILQSEIGQMQMRLLPGSAWAKAEITDVYDPANNPAGLTTSFNYTWTDAYNPIAQFVQTNKNGVPITDFTAAFALTDVFNFAFKMTDPNGDLAHAVLVAVQGQQEVTLWSSNFSLVGSASANVQFSLPTGTWQIYLRLLDGAGNQTQLPLSSGGATVQMQVQATPVSVAPIVYVIRKTSLAEQIIFGPYTAAQEAGVTLYYQIQPVGTQPSGGAWIAATAGLQGGNYFFFKNGSGYPIVFGKNYCVYAYTHTAGMTDSAIQLFTF